MNYRVRALSIGTRKEGFAEFKKIGADAAGCNIMINKTLPLALKVKGISLIAANILKQEMLSRGGDVVTSREILCSTEGKTDVIILATGESIKSLIKKIKILNLWIL